MFFVTLLHSPKKSNLCFSHPCNVAAFVFSFVHALFTPLNAMSCKQIIVIFKTHFLVSRKNIVQKGRNVFYLRAWIALEGNGRPQWLSSLCVTCAEGRCKWSVEWFRGKKQGRCYLLERKHHCW